MLDPHAVGPGNPDSSARFVESSSQLSGCGQSRPDSASQMEDHFLRSGPVPTLLYCLPLGCLHLVFILKTETFTMGVRVSEFRPSWSPEHWMPGLAGGEAPCPSPLAHCHGTAREDTTAAFPVCVLFSTQASGSSHSVLACSHLTSPREHFTAEAQERPKVGKRPTYCISQQVTPAVGCSSCPCRGHEISGWWSVSFTRAAAGTTCTAEQRPVARNPPCKKYVFPS